jgi:hypothetical protein
VINITLFSYRLTSTGSAFFFLFGLPMISGWLPVEPVRVVSATCSEEIVTQSRYCLLQRVAAFLAQKTSYIVFSSWRQMEMQN